MVLVLHANLIIVVGLALCLVAFRRANSAVLYRGENSTAVK